MSEQSPQSKNAARDSSSRSSNDCRAQTQAGASWEVFRSREEAAGDDAGRELLERLEADPQLAARFETRCRFDERLAEALAEVETPAGLKERLLGTLGRPESRTFPQPTEECPSVRPDSGERPRSSVETPGRSTSRRRWLAAMAVAATLLLSLGLAYLWSERRTWSAADLALASQQWLDAVDPDGWKPPSGHERRFPLPPGLGVRFRQAQLIAVDGADVAVYRGRVVGRNQTSVFLFVLRTRAGSDVPPSPPLRPRMATNGWLVASWQAQGCVYVLRLQGTELDYRRAINADAPLAFAPSQSGQPVNFRAL